MTEIGDIPVLIEQEDGGYISIPLGDAVRQGLLNGLKVEVHGTGIVTNPEPVKGSEA